MSSPTSDLVQVNVGGVLYTTTQSTLTRHPDSMLGAMFKGDIPSNRDANGNYFIDRDGNLFRHVLNFLRCSKLNLPKDFNEMAQLRAEADFYQIQPLIDSIDHLENTMVTSPGIFIEVKDHIHCYKGWHINTSIAGPIDMLRQQSPFKEEITLSARAPYCAWNEGNIQELFLDKCSKTRLDWAISLKKCGWSLVSTTSSSHSRSATDMASESQQFIIIDKWFLASKYVEETLTTS